MVTDSEIGVLIGIVEVIRAIRIIDADDGRHQQGIDKAVGDTCRVGRRVEDLFLSSGQALLLRTAIGGIDTKLQVLLQLPFHIGMEIVTLKA